MKKTHLLAVLAAPALLAVGSLALAGGHSGGGAAGDAKAGEQKAGLCLSCHTGADFAGLDESGINGAIKGVAAGNAEGHPDISNLSDQDIADISAFLAAAAAG